jgi:L-alanine-DL-glutamate epimerase-like enolase superfamily enzyme
MLCLLVTQNDSSSFVDETSMTAVELLTAFSGEKVKQNEPFFRFSEETRIISVEIYAVGTKSTTARYTDEPIAWKEVNNILRITTADGYEAISGVTTNDQARFSDKYLIELQGVMPVLLALQTLDPVEVAAKLNRTRPDLSDRARSSIDIALWDLAARKAGLPLYKLLGAKRHSMEPYASFPFYDSLPATVAAVEKYSRLGFKTFKFHAWGQIDKDAQLIDIIQQTFSGTPYRFMMDFEAAYDIDDALSLGRKMDPELFAWLEGPIDDVQLEQYAELRRKLSVPIIPAGNKIYSAEFIRQGIENQSWDAGRFDLTVVGGYTRALELMIIANGVGLPIEIQSWDHSLSQVANLHLMLANERTRYFEAPMPKEAFEFGMKNGNLLEHGRVVAPQGPGLGIDVDWDRLATADFYTSTE